MYIFTSSACGSSSLLHTLSPLFKVHTKLIEHLLRRHQPHKQEVKTFEILSVDKGRPSRGSLTFLKNKAVLPGNDIQSIPSPLKLCWCILLFRSIN
jgi:hypothetical protein